MKRTTTPLDRSTAPLDRSTAALRLSALAVMTAGMLAAGVPAHALQSEAPPPPPAMQSSLWLPVSGNETAGAPEGQNQVKDDLFAGTEKFAKGASDVTDVNLGPDMLGMVAGKGSGDLAKKIRFVLVRTYTYPRAEMYNLADVDAYRQKLRDGSWSCFVHTFESKTGESTDICSRPAADHSGNEMVILTVEPKELTFIHLGGNVSMADLGSLGNLANIPAPPKPPAPPK